MSEKIASADFVDLMQECFSRGLDVTFTPSGTSMLPMLDGRTDMVTLSPKPQRLKKYDVAFYQRQKTGQLVMHRMVGFTKSGGYIFCGDNQYAYEYGVEHDDVLALMTSFTHRGKKRDVNAFSYRLYIHRMMLKKRSRKFISKAYHFLIDRIKPSHSNTK